MITEKQIVQILNRSIPKALHKKISKTEIAREIVRVSKTFTESTWVTFELQVRKFDQITDVYQVRTKGIGYSIGIIKWDPIVRAYSFYPNPNTTLETTCLQDITDFIHTLMEEWRQQRAKKLNQH